MKKINIKERGFTLIEILLVIAIIAILAGIVIIAINPSRQLGEANNAQRHSDARAIYQALEQYYIDNIDYPSDIPSDLTEVCDTGDIEGDGSSDPSGLNCDADGYVDLSDLVPDYLAAIPTDPQGQSVLGWLVDVVYAAEGSGYLVAAPGGSSEGGVVVVAPNTQNLSSNSDLVIQQGTTTLTYESIGGDISGDEDSY